MKQHRWQVVAMATVLLGVGATGMAQVPSPFTGPPPVPRTLENFLPRVGHSISTVNNFTGVVAVALIQGTGRDNAGNTIDFELDVRAMQGNYRDRDGNSQRGTFAFT